MTGLRLTTRRWLVVVVAAAVVLAGVRELRYRSVRDRCSAAHSYHVNQAGRNEGWRLECLRNAANGLPYDTAARRDRPDQDFGLYPSLAPDFESWEAEARDHAAWAETYRESAAQARARQHDAERHLTFP